jgi:uncharacterized protein (DUF2126 family)
LESNLLIEYCKFGSKSGPYGTKWRSVGLVVKRNMATNLAQISDINKPSVGTRVIKLFKFKNRNLLVAKTMFKAIAEDPGLAPEVRLFGKLVFEILDMVTQARGNRL